MNDESQILYEFNSLGVINKMKLFSIVRKHIVLAPVEMMLIIRRWWLTILW